MKQLEQILADAATWDLNPVSKYSPPFAFRAYGTIALDDAVPCCAMETICLALGAPAAGVHPRVNPVLSAIIRSTNDGIDNDEVRTRILWPYLPQVIVPEGCGTRERRWEHDIYMMILDRRLSTLETHALLRAPDEAISFAVSADLEERELNSTKLSDLLRFAVRTYWAARVDQPQDDWTPSQYFCINAYAKRQAMAAGS